MGRPGGDLGKWPWPSGISPSLRQAPEDLSGWGLRCWSEILTQRREGPFMERPSPMAEALWRPHVMEGGPAPHS